jgi:diguanylate cyclase (GGDEF)-like protein
MMPRRSRAATGEARLVERRRDARRSIDRSRWQEFGSVAGLSFALGWLMSDARARQRLDDTLRRGLGGSAPVPGGASAVPSMNLLLGQIEHVTSMATTDALTGIGNRQRLMAELAAAVEVARANGAWLGMCMVDIDHFKAVNDRIGHDAGDVVLRQVAQRMREMLAEGETIGRYGGEEFVVLLPKLDASQTQARADDLRRAVAERPCMLRDETPVSVTASFGVAATYGDLCHLDAMLNAADRALLLAKEAGRNRVVAMDPLVPPPTHSD